MAVTYEPIATTTLGSAASEIILNSIPNTYTDIVCVLVGTHETSSATIRMQVNSDTGTNYGYRAIYGDGSTAQSTSGSSSGRINAAPNWASTYTCMAVIEWFSYAGSTYKSCLINSDTDQSGSGTHYSTVGLWQNTSAITSIRLFPSSGNFATGTKATLYGIKEA